MSAPVRIGGVSVAPGERASVHVAMPKLYTQAQVTLPVHVINARRPGPRLFVSAAIHGDEINGVEIVRRLLQLPRLRSLRGVLLAVPVVNVYGFIARSRYLPDRRDLNRSFPGSDRGSLAARLAELFMREVVRGSDAGIDLHTGARHRENLPQVRATLDDGVATERLARAFGAPVLLNAGLRDGSLREAAAAEGVPLLVYEAGEALRFDELSIRAGLRGILAVMRELGMLPASRHRRKGGGPVVARSSAWVRAGQSGILRAVAGLGQRVDKGSVLGVIGDPFGEHEAQVASPHAGIVIGRTNLPLVSEGEGIYHIARFGEPDEAEETVEAFRATIDGPDPEAWPQADTPA